MYCYILFGEATLRDLTPNQIWQAVLGHLEVQMSRPSYLTWLKPTVGVSFENNLLTVGAPSSFHSQMLQSRMINLIQTTATKVLGGPCDVCFVLSGATPQSPPLTNTAGGHSSRHLTRGTGPAPDYPKLNPKYTLDSFVVGPSNQFAHAAALAVTHNPGVAYNPLFLYGGVGLGKTHLLQGIGRTFLNQGLNCVYINSEQFTNEFILSIQTKKTREFRNKFRSADVLLVDDIQFIAGKEAIQEGFFHTFNELHNNNKQIVLACDRPSASLKYLEERLLSRFDWGLSADIQKPDQETRLAILSAKAASLGSPVPADVLSFIAARFSSSVRELEGALNRVFAYSDLTAVPLSLELANISLSDLLSSSNRTVPSSDQILSEVASFYKVDGRLLSGNRKDRLISRARQTAVYLLRETGELSLSDIASTLGGRDYSTIRHSWTKVTSLLKEDPDLRQEISAIQEELTLG